MKNIRSVLEIAHETLFLLRRGPIFVPALIFSIMVALFGTIASTWGVSEFRKILFDIGAFAFHFIGCIIAIVWSVKILAIARIEGSLEVQLASPVSRSSWLLGRFLGIFTSLLILGVFMLGIWQGVMFLTNFGWLRQEEFFALALQILGWGVVASIALFFATFCGLITALFSSFALWISGLLVEVVFEAVREDVGPSLKTFFHITKCVWNLENFNRTPSFILDHGLNYVGWSFIYGVLLIAFFLVSGTFTFSQSFE